MRTTITFIALLGLPTIAAAQAPPTDPPPTPTTAPAADPAPAAEPPPPAPPPTTTAPVDAEPAPAVIVTEAPPAAGWKMAIAPRVGVTIATAELGPMAVVGLEISAAVAAQRRLLVGLDISWSRPGRDGSVSDPRVPSPAMYTIEQTEVVIALQLGYRFAGAEKKLVPWLAGGPLLHLLQTRQTTTIAPGENTASATEAGVQLAGGVDFKAGPGFLVGDVRFAYSSLDNVLTGASNAGKVMIAAGYRIGF